MSIHEEFFHILDKYLYPDIMKIVKDYLIIPRRQAPVAIWNGEQDKYLTGDNLFISTTVLYIYFSIKKLVIFGEVHTLVILGKIEHLECYGVQYLHCSNMGLSSLICPHAMDINCSNNNLSLLDCHGAQYVDCSNNKIQYLKCDYAIHVDCSRNRISELRCPRATKITCIFNTLGKLYCPAVLKLYCEGNALKKIICPKGEEIKSRCNTKLEKIYAPDALHIEHSMPYGEITCNDQTKITKVKDKGRLCEYLTYLNSISLI